MRANASPLVIFLIFVTCKCEDAALRFYHGSLNNYTQLELDECHHILNTTWYNSSLGTVVFAHGFTGTPDGPAVTSIIQAYLDLGSENVVLLNWQDLAAPVQQSLPSSYVNWAAPNARKLGAKFAAALLNLLESGLNLNTTHLVGHSLGAQLFGITGNHLATKGIWLPWITGLDPASIGFENRSPALKLHAGSATFVDIIHSDPSKYGYKKPMGTADFWPNYRNGAVVQPGCIPGPHQMFTPEDLCNHNRSWQYLISVLKRPGSIMGCLAKNYRTWKMYSNDERRATTLALGTRPDNVIPGDYFFITNSAEPYGLSEEGL